MTKHKKFSDDAIANFCKTIATKCVNAQKNNNTELI